jgi:ATP-dependent DNA helicase RecQ
MDNETALRDALGRYWGYDDFLPLQREAMEAVLDGADSIVVLPTGGGKSLCFQAPAVIMPGTAVVVSPLISLMKDQVDTLGECGIAAERIDSSLTPDERSEAEERLMSGELKLVYVAPERMMLGGFIRQLKEIEVSFLAVDEAHCVSMWGHDFRPEYRQLGLIKSRFKGLGVHGYTATATEHVRADIAEQLRLKSPEVLVGSFDRPNLRYSAERRHDRMKQVLEVIERHPRESGIIYCITRKDVERMSSGLKRKGHRAVPYHAGMSSVARKRSQDAFIRDRADIVVATVAFGMGIDKPNVRYVIHAAMPKSLEHYQQESGRAGRDGLEADCALFYSAQDYAVWRSILGDKEPEALEVATTKLNSIRNYCTDMVCRHRAIVRYFGQDLEGTGCGACDVCLGTFETIDDCLVTGQKIMSCVARLRERFGGGYTASVLVGSKEARVLSNGHDKLSTYALLADFPKRAVRDWIEQLVAQGYLRKSADYDVLKVTARGLALLEGEDTPQLLKPLESKRAAKPKPSSRGSGEAPAADVDDDLLGRLRAFRLELARSNHVPAYIIFGDVTMRELASAMPTDEAALLGIHGIGEARLEKYGTKILEVIRAHKSGGGRDAQ